MLTVKDGIETRLNGSPYLRDALCKGLINMSSLARELQPQIARDLRKPVSVPAVLMALKRFSEELEGTGSSSDAVDHLGNLSLRADLVQLTVANSDRLMQIIGEILLRSRHDRSSFFVFTRAAYETSLAISGGLQSVVEPWLANERVTRRRVDLSALSMQRLHQPARAGRSGVLHIPLQVLAWQGVEVLDVISTDNEVMLLVRDDDVDRAIATLRPLLQSTGKSA